MLAWPLATAGRARRAQILNVTGSYGGVDYTEERYAEAAQLVSYLPATNRAPGNRILTCLQDEEAHEDVFERARPALTDTRFMLLSEGGSAPGIPAAPRETAPEPISMIGSRNRRRPRSFC